MKVLVVGSGGREHALAWKIAQSPRVRELYAAPGNAGSARVATPVPIAADRIDDLVAFAKARRVDLTVIGPEVPLTLGLADRLEAEGLLAFGPRAAGARLEGSKAFMKEVLDGAGVPTARYGAFTDPAAARAFARELGAPLVVKADGLAAGKGVLICETLADADRAIAEVMEARAFGDAGKVVVVEEFLVGEEASFIAFTDGTRVLPLAPSQDHKRVFDGDRGPNTGGMGAYSPAPVVDEAVTRAVIDRILTPTVDGLRARGIDFRGILYAGLMIDRGVPKVLEYNVRLGDPEAQPLLARMKSDLVPLLVACARGDLSGQTIQWDERPAVCVVMAAGGYPGEYRKGSPITGIADAEADPDVVVFHAGTAMKDDRVVTAGGRVLGVTALGETIRGAIDRAYAACDRIRWDGVQYRRDIGARALGRM
jgi:phosphoribosylamine--glycine ligase